MPLKTKLLLITILPIVLVAALITSVNYFQSRQLIDKETTTIRTRVLAEKRQEIRNYIHLARSAIQDLYDNEPGGREAAQAAAKDILTSLTFGEDGYYFAYSTNGTNLVHPKLTYLIGRNWLHLEDVNGVRVIKDLITAAQNGGGFVEYLWHKPSAGKIKRKIAYSILFEKWDWMVGTGLYLDDIDLAIATMRKDFSRSVTHTNIVILSVTICVIVIVSLIMATLHLSEQRFADKKLKELNNRVHDVQELERKRVATELHDSISQMLVSIRYGLELIQNAVTKPEALKKHSDKCLQTLDATLSEVRRISRDLRPSVLDDIGLSAALVTLANEFEDRSGVSVYIHADRCRTLLPENAKTAIYRVVQEAMTNIAKHAEASMVWIDLEVTGTEIRLKIEDNGKGLPTPLPTGGFGFRNMRERMETHGGSLQLSNRPKGGTKILVALPLKSNPASMAS
ncbi:MAG: cache domain-containing protein [Rhodobacteraceae bacterium]|nr:cache domain-containing protein [Paracoccaceae bacterium]